MRMLVLPIIFLLAGQAHAQRPAPNTSDRMNAPGPEATALAARAGQWDVVRTVWPSPDSAPIVTRMLADRQMLGGFLQENLYLTAEPGPSAVARIDYLHFNRIERRWQYVSMDTRFPGGIMPAWSFDRGTEHAIVVRFEPIAMVGFGVEPELIGRMERAEMTIIRNDADHDAKEMRVVMTDGEAEPWTAVRFDYTRRTKSR